MFNQKLIFFKRCDWFCGGVSLKTELFKLSYPGSTPAPPSPTPTIAPRCLLGLTFPDFDLALKRNEKFGYGGLDLV